MAQDPSHIHTSNSNFFRDFWMSFTSGSEEEATDRTTLIAGSGDRDQSDEFEPDHKAAAPKPSKSSGYRSVQFCYAGYSRNLGILWHGSMNLQ